MDTVAPLNMPETMWRARGMPPPTPCISDASITISGARVHVGGAFEPDGDGTGVAALEADGDGTGVAALERDGTGVAALEADGEGTGVAAFELDGTGAAVLERAGTGADRLEVESLGPSEGDSTALRSSEGELTALGTSEVDPTTLGGSHGLVGLLRMDRASSEHLFLCGFLSTNMLQRFRCWGLLSFP